MAGFAWDTGVTVNLDLLGHLIEMIQELGLDLVVGEGAGWGQLSDDVFNRTGARKLVENYGIELHDFKRGEVDPANEVKLDIPEPLATKTATVDRVVRDCDFIISLAKLKTHCETGASLSLKNMKGLITRDRERIRFHLLDVHKCIVDLNKLFKPSLSIVEGLIALEGIGPLVPGTPLDLGVLVAGTDPVAVDSTCCRVMHFDPADIKHIKLASENGLGRIKPEEIEIAGRTLESVTPLSFAHPPDTIEGISPYEQIKIVDGKPCSNCIAALASNIHGYLDKNKAEKATHQVKILFGAKAKAKFTGDEIAIGNCLKRYDGKIPYCPGCPPPGDVYLKLVEKALEGKLQSAGE